MSRFPTVEAYYGAVGVGVNLISPSTSSPGRIGPCSLWVAWPGADGSMANAGAKSHIEVVFPVEVVGQ